MAENLEADGEAYNKTMIKFGAPDSVIHQYDYWCLLVRPVQVTLGALVLAARESAGSFSELSKNAFEELSVITRDIEMLLRERFQYDKLNYLMLMMVDPDVHFHVIPRYADARNYLDVEFVDAGWPGPPDLGKGMEVEASWLQKLAADLTTFWSTER